MRAPPGALTACSLLNPTLWRKVRKEQKRPGEPARPACTASLKADLRRQPNPARDNQVRMRVLVVEDDPMIGRAVVSGLQDGGYAADWVRDGAEADLALANGVYDLALLDLGLPRRDGLEILKSVRRSGKELPVVIITARDALEDRVKGLDSGADDYLVKPFDLDELLARVRAVLRRRAGRGTPELAYGALM